MADEREQWRRAVDDFYGDEVESHFEAGEDVAAASLEPRPKSFLVDLLGELRLTSASRLLDVGSRDGRHLEEIASRYGCAVVGVEAAPGNLAKLRRQHPTAARWTTGGLAEALPVASSSIDVVWVRDVLCHVEPLAVAFGEIGRVLRPDGVALVYHVLATDDLSEREAAEAFAPSRIVPANADPASFEAAIREGGLTIERREDVGGEYIERCTEDRGPTATDRLLAIGRLRRRPDHYRSLLGDELYAIELGERLVSAYQLLGKLSPTVYVLRPANAG